MKIEGKVTSGMGKAEFFLSKEVYTKEFKKNLGFIPFPGTLNVMVNEEYLEEINEIRDNCENIIEPDDGFGSVKYVKTKINDSIDGAIVFPAKTTHEIHYLEVISEKKLRDELNLNDGDIISLEF